MKRVLTFIILFVFFGGITFSETFAQETASSNEYDFVEYDVQTGEQKIIPFSEELYNQMPNHIEASPRKAQTFGIIGQDDRELVTNTAQFPFSAVSQLEYKGADFSIIASGALIQKDLLLTCAHAVWNNDFFTNGVIVPGRTGYWNKPFGEAKMKKIYILKEYMTKGGIKNDFALIKLDRPIGEKTGWLGLSYADKIGEDFTLSGYPGDKNYYMYTESQPINETLTYEHGGVQFDKKSWMKDELHYLLDSFGGQSGSPVYDSEAQVSAVHTSGISMGGTTTYNAGSRISKEKFAMINKIINQGGNDYVPIERIEINPSKVTLAGGDAYTLKVEVFPKNATYQTINWSSDNKWIPVDEFGKITAPFETMTKATITAKSVDGEKTATCEVNIVPEKINVTGVTIEPKELNLSLGETQTLKAIVLPENATNKTVVWTTENDSIATVSDTGEVVALAKGTTQAIATTEDGQKQFATTINVDDKIESVQITNKREKVVLLMNQSTKSSAKVLPEMSNQSIIWESEFPEIATVDEKGNVIAKSFGRTKITAKSKIDPTKSDSYIVITDDHGDFDNPTLLGLGRPVNGRYDFDEKERIDGLSYYKDEDYFIFQAPEDGTYVYYYYATHEENNETFLVPVDRVSFIESQNKWDFNKRKPVMQELKLSKGEIFILGISGEDYTGMDDMMAVSPRMKTFVGTKYTVLIDKEENVSKGEIVIKDNKNKDVTGNILEMRVGESLDLSGEIVNSNILNPFYFELNWSSDNKNIVEVEPTTGKITAKKAGEVKIKSANQFYGGMFQHQQEVLNTQITVRVK